MTNVQAGFDHRAIIGTDGAEIVLADLERLLDHRHDPSGWQYTAGATLEDRRSGRFLYFSTGGDGGYEVRVTDGVLEPREAEHAAGSIVLRLRVGQAGLLLDGGYAWPNADSPALDDSLGARLNVPSGDYAATITAIDRPTDGEHNFTDADHPEGPLADYVVRLTTVDDFIDVPMMDARPDLRVYENPSTSPFDPMSYFEEECGEVPTVAIRRPLENGRDSAARMLDDIAVADDRVVGQQGKVRCERRDDKIRQRELALELGVRGGKGAFVPVRASGAADLTKARMEVTTHPGVVVPGDRPKHAFLERHEDVRRGGRRAATIAAGRGRARDVARVSRFVRSRESGHLHHVLVAPVELSRPATPALLAEPSGLIERDRGRVVVVDLELDPFEPGAGGLLETPVEQRAADAAASGGRGHPHAHAPRVRGGLAGARHHIAPADDPPAVQRQQLEATQPVELLDESVQLGERVRSGRTEPAPLADHRVQHVREGRHIVNRDPLVLDAVRGARGGHVAVSSPVRHRRQRSVPSPPAGVRWRAPAERVGPTA